MLDDFTHSDLSPRWFPTRLGNGTLTIQSSSLLLTMGPAAQGMYTDAQIDDYGKRKRADFPWYAPLKMEVRARASHRAATDENISEDAGFLHGTAGFGFWNYPFSVRGDILMLPEAIWFFYASPPSNMALVPDSPGWGWKAQVVHSMRGGALASLLPTALSMGWGHLSGDSHSAARWLQRLSGTSESVIKQELTDWHTYRLEWLPDSARFFVDDQPILTVPDPPTRALGFVAWIDNQYAVATPRGALRFGSIACDQQWLEMDYVKITSLSDPPG